MGLSLTSPHAKKVFHVPCVDLMHLPYVDRKKGIWEVRSHHDVMVPVSGPVSKKLRIVGGKGKYARISSLSVSQSGFPYGGLERAEMRQAARNGGVRRSRKEHFSGT